MRQVKYGEGMSFQVPRMTEEESAAWLGLTAVTQLLPSTLDAQLQADAQMTHYEFAVLTALRLAPDATMQMSALAQSTNSTLSRLSHVCTRMEKRGWVERSTCPGNGRITNVRLCSTGRRELIRATPDHINTARRLVIDALTPEQLNALTEITTVIRDRLTGNTDWGPPSPRSP
ncbi:DNA-binding MarR family transcriptional regulator [Leucobacter luti]|uniref:DNA-binding MarR family transcriptional regulator n=2 Tax=Leucobacter luti TaxID=340320 RepID=A0A4R6RU15_9MICO|nr:DNA-binding MarR family transcriptional regulator [Leucobacter luti]